MTDTTIAPDDIAATEQAVRSGFWRTFRRAARWVPFSRELVAAYYCALDPDVPLRVRATLLAALAYFVLPTDAIPDLLPVIGFTDDVTVLTAAIGLVASHIRPEHRAAADRTLGT